MLRCQHCGGRKFNPFALQCSGCRRNSAAYVPSLTADVAAPRLYDHPSLRQGQRFIADDDDPHEAVFADWSKFEKEIGIKW